MFRAIICLAAFLAAAPPPGQVRMSEEPTVGAGALWYNFDADLSNLVPDAGASGLVYGVIFTAGSLSLLVVRFTS